MERACGFGKRGAVLLVCGLFLFCLTPSAAEIGPPAPKPSAAGPELMSFQGDLRDGSGKALNGTYPMTFRLYDAASGGTLLLTDAHTGVGALVTVTDGLFVTVLGGGTVTPGSQPSLGAAFANLSAVWIEIQVSTETLGPRMQVTSAAYAQNARTLDGKGSAEFAGAAHQHPGSDVTSPVAQAASATTAASADDSDKLDGQHAAAFAGAVHGHAGSDISGPVAQATSATTATSAADSDKLDGQHADAFAGAIHGHSGSDISGPVAQATTATNATNAGNADTLDGEHATAFADAVHAHDASAISSGALPADHGGTGITSPGASGNLLTSNGSAWTSAVPPTAGALGAVVDASDPTLTRSGFGTAASPYKLALNLGRDNVWTGSQFFDSASYFPGDGTWSNSGWIGIGTVTPERPIDVRAVYASARLTTTGVALGAGLELRNAMTNATQLGSIDFNNALMQYPGQIAYTSQDMMTFRTAGSERMRINHEGLLGLGTSSPTASLHIVRENCKVKLQSNTNQGGSIIYLTNAHPTNDWVGRVLFTDDSIMTYYGGITGKKTGMSFETLGTVRMWLDGSGNLGVGTTSPTCTLDVSGNVNLGDSSASNMLYLKSKQAVWTDGDYFSWGYGGTANRFYDPVGIGGIDPSYKLQISADSAAKPGTSTWTVASDLRLKKDIAPFTDGLEVLEKIKPISFRYNGLAGLPADMPAIGVAAQEIREVAPYTVGTFRARLRETDAEKTELLDFNSHALTFVLINAVKELSQKIEAISGQASAKGEAAGTRAASSPSGGARRGAGALPADPDSAPDILPAHSAPAPPPYLASSWPVCEAVEPGDLLSTDAAHPGHLCLSAAPGDPGIVGVVVPSPDALPARTPADSPPSSRASVALGGLARAKADAGYGPIALNDLLVASPTPGHAMRAQSPAPGTVLGKALEPLEAGTGTIQILIMSR